MTAVKQGIVKVGEADYRWSVFRQPSWTSGRDGQFTLFGLAILVVPPEPSHRELLLEFEIDPNRPGDMPPHQRFRLPEGRLVGAIESAIRAGWDPGSRGKRFHHEGGALQPR